MILSDIFVRAEGGVCRRGDNKARRHDLRKTCYYDNLNVHFFVDFACLSMTYFYNNAALQDERVEVFTSIVHKYPNTVTFLGIRHVSATYM